MVLPWSRMPVPHHDIDDVDVKDFPQELEDITLCSVDWLIQLDCLKLKCIDNIQLEWRCRTKAIYLSWSLEEFAKLNSRSNSTSRTGKKPKLSDVYEHKKSNKRIWEVEIHHSTKEFLCTHIYCLVFKVIVLTAILDQLMLQIAASVG